MKKTDYEFGMEMRLHQLNPELHRLFSDTVFALKNGLSSYKSIFPEYTDHTILHCMNVIRYCNQLIGDQIIRLNGDEIYILLMSCCLHDSGMGVMKKDFEAFSARINFGDYFETHVGGSIPDMVRAFHHEFSGQFIRKYAELLEIPSAEHEWAIIQVSRGHRKTDLMDETEYPTDFRMPNGNKVCLPYLAALIRLADEIDVAADRNPTLLYDITTVTDKHQIIENKMVRAVRRLLVTDLDFTLVVYTEEDEIRAQILKLADKIQSTLDYCRTVVKNRTPYTITQEKVLIKNADC